MFKDSGPQKPLNVWVLEPETLNIGHLDPLGHNNINSKPRRTTLGGSGSFRTSERPDLEVPASEGCNHGENPEGPDAVH